MASGALSLPIRARPAFRSAHPHVMLYAAMLLVTVLALLPFVWAFVTSLKPERQIFAQHSTFARAVGCDIKARRACP